MDIVDSETKSICGVPVEEAVKVLTIYRQSLLYDFEGESNKAWVRGFEIGYNQAIREMRESLERSLKISEGYRNGTMSNLPPMPQKTENS